jgi:hypothetical protein
MEFNFLVPNEEQIKIMKDAENKWPSYNHSSKYDSSSEKEEWDQKTKSTHNEDNQDGGVEADVLKDHIKFISSPPLSQLDKQSVKDMENKLISLP